MSRLLKIGGLIVLLPYAYVGWYWLDLWLFAETTRIEAQMLLYSFILLMALPFVMAFLAISSSLTGAKALKDDLAERKPVRATARAGFVWLAVIVAVPALYTSHEIYSIWFPEVEEGRDRLGRICVDHGTSVKCRPDPETKRSALDLLNEYRPR